MTKSPEVGQLELVGKSGPVQEFTQEDIEKNHLIYKHLGGAKNLEDKFSFKVVVYDIVVEDEFHVRLFPAVYWEPLVLVNNRTLRVDEATDLQITRDDLLVCLKKGIRIRFYIQLLYFTRFNSVQVQQALVPPSDITYFVVEQPKYGFLEIEVNGHFSEVEHEYLFHPNSTNDAAITFFDQATVDAEKLHYIQVILNQTYDRVVLDVTNGIMWIRNIVVSTNTFGREVNFEES